MAADYREATGKGGVKTARRKAREKRTAAKAQYRTRVSLGDVNRLQGERKKAAHAGDGKAVRQRGEAIGGARRRAQAHRSVRGKAARRITRPHPGQIAGPGTRPGAARRINKAYDPIEVVLDRLAEQRGEAIAKSLDDLVSKKCSKCRPGKKCKMHAEPDGDEVEKSFRRPSKKARRRIGRAADIAAATGIGMGIGGTMVARDMKRQAAKRGPRP